MRGSLAAAIGDTLKNQAVIVCPLQPSKCRRRPIGRKVAATPAAHFLTTFLGLRRNALATPGDTRDTLQSWRSTFVNSVSTNPDHFHKSKDCYGRC